MPQLTLGIPSAEEHNNGMNAHSKTSSGPVTQAAEAISEAAAGSLPKTEFKDFSDPSNRPVDPRIKAEYANYQALVERTIDVFGSEVKASRWLSMPSVDLGGKIPLQVAQSVSYSASEIERIFEPIFVQIEHGIYS